jgi:hypothetical protein
LNNTVKNIQLKVLEENKRLNDNKKKRNKDVRERDSGKTTKTLII